MFNTTVAYTEHMPNEDGHYVSFTGYNYSFIFAYERKYFNETYMISQKEWMTYAWQNCFPYVLIYLASIYFGQVYMKTREKFELRTSLIAWNFVLAFFSAFGAIRVWPEFIYVINRYGIEHSYCSSDWQFGVTGGWGGFFSF